MSIDHLIPKYQIMILIKYPTINNTYYPTYFKFLLFTGILKCYSIVNNYVILLVLRGKHTPTILHLCI
jgi:hypothetical protein